MCVVKNEGINNLVLAIKVLRREMVMILGGGVLLCIADKRYYYQTGR